MELQEIDVFIEHSGEVRIEVRGAKGASCLALTKELEAALGGQVISREQTPEMNESSTSQDTFQSQRHG